MIQVESDTIFSRIGVVEIRAAIVVLPNALAGYGALDSAALARRVVGREGLEIAQEINCAPPALFDSNHRGAEARHQTRRLWPNL